MVWLPRGDAPYRPTIGLSHNSVLLILVNRPYTIAVLYAGRHHHCRLKDKDIETESSASLCASRPNENNLLQHFWLLHYMTSSISSFNIFIGPIFIQYLQCPCSIFLRSCHYNLDIYNNNNSFWIAFLQRSAQDYSYSALGLLVK